MKIIIVCVSTYNGNTLRIANAIGRVLNAKVISSEEFKNIDLNQYDVIGLGSAIHFKKHNPELLKLVNFLPNNSKKVFMFSTRANPFIGNYHKYLKDQLLEKGHIVIGEFSSIGFDATGPFSIIGGVHKGHPNENDIKKAENFAVSLQLVPQPIHPFKFGKLNKLPLKKYNLDVYSGVVNDDKVYLYGTKVTVDWNKCIGCGKCKINCPLDIYDLVTDSDSNCTKAVPTRELDCIQCRICEKACEKKAIYICGTWKDAFRIAKRHANR